MRSVIFPSVTAIENDEYDGDEYDDDEYNHEVDEEEEEETFEPHIITVDPKNKDPKKLKKYVVWTSCGNIIPRLLLTYLHTKCVIVV